jgi:hypothetical protein
MNETLMSGKYFLGDPLSVLHPRIHIGIWDNLYHCDNGLFTINDVHFAVHNTHYGDGIFNDTKNRKYKIESGTIALVHIDLIENIDLCKNNGYIFDFKNKVTFIYDAGIFIIKSGKKYIQIDTRVLEEYNSDIEDSFLDEDKEHVSNKIIDDSDDDFIMDENDDLFNAEDDADEDDGEDENEKEKKEKDNIGNLKKTIKFFK